MTQAQIMEAIEGYRQRRQNPRPSTAGEEALQKELDEITEYRQSLAPDSQERQALADYARAVRENLHQEQQINDALWEWSGVPDPELATRADWQRTEAALRDQAQAMYEKFTPEGIELRTQRDRMALPGKVQECVFGEWRTVHRGRFSRTAAQRIEADRWHDAKNEISSALARLLRYGGYSAGDLKGTTMKQRQRLLEELGSGSLLRVRSGRVAKVGNVPVERRLRALGKIDASMQERCAYVSTSPLECPGLGCFDRMVLADLISIRYLGGQQPPGGTHSPAPLNF
jgi:hypothetical protein